ncbi:MAG TPA: DUF2802 domain-containing protein [Thauera sp.]|nr:DUF2802 domain-containing protein [Thauera sp.]
MREALWLLVLLLAAYAGWQFLAALRSRAPRGEASVKPPAAGAAGGGRAAARASDAAGPAAAIDLEQAEDDDADYAPVLRRDLAPVEAPAASDAAAQSVAASFQLRLDNQRLQRELGSLQQVVDRQQEEIANLLADIDALRARLDGAAPEPGISPEYSEALVLARQGLNAEMIATRCGITQAEAELVLSIASAGGRHG